MYIIKFAYIEDGKIKIGDYVTCFSEEMKNKCFEILKKHEDIIHVWYEGK